MLRQTHKIPEMEEYLQYVACACIGTWIQGDQTVLGNFLVQSFSHLHGGIRSILQITRWFYSSYESYNFYEW